MNIAMDEIILDNLSKLSAADLKALSDHCLEQAVLARTERQKSKLHKCRRMIRTEMDCRVNVVFGEIFKRR